MTTNPRRRARTRALAASLGIALTLVLATTAPAGASVTVTPTSQVNPPLYTGGDEVTVSGTEPNAAADVFAVAQCVTYDFDTSTAVTPGTRCSTTSATSITPLTGGTSYSVPNYVLEESWTTSKDYTNPTSTSFADSVNCVNNTPATSGEQCAIIVSYYDTPSFTPIGPDVASLTFN